VGSHLDTISPSSHSASHRQPALTTSEPVATLTDDVVVGAAAAAPAPAAAGGDKGGDGGTSLYRRLEAASSVCRVQSPPPSSAALPAPSSRPPSLVLGFPAYPQRETRDSFALWMVHGSQSAKQRGDSGREKADSGITPNLEASVPSSAHVLVGGTEAAAQAIGAQSSRVRQKRLMKVLPPVSATCDSCFPNAPCAASITSNIAGDIDHPSSPPLTSLIPPRKSPRALS